MQNVGFPMMRLICRIGTSFLPAFSTIMQKPKASLYMNSVVRKSLFRVSDQSQHKPGCTAIEDGWRLEILDLESRAIVLPMVLA